MFQRRVGPRLLEQRAPPASSALPEQAGGNPHPPVCIKSEAPMWPSKLSAGHGNRHLAAEPAGDSFRDRGGPAAAGPPPMGVMPRRRSGSGKMVSRSGYRRWWRAPGAAHLIFQLVRYQALLGEMHGKGVRRTGRALARPMRSALVCLTLESILRAPVHCLV